MGSEGGNGLYRLIEVDSKLKPFTKGLSDARVAIRRQIARILKEVCPIEKDPKLETDEDHTEPYQAPGALKARISVVKVPKRLYVKRHPLSSKRMAAKNMSDEEQQKQIEEEHDAID
jgi:hypothetical protein